MVPYESQVEISVVSGIIYFKEKSLVKARDDLDFDNGVIGLMKVGAFPTVQWHIFHAYSERDPKARLCVICRIGLRVAIMHRVRLTGSLSFTCQGILMHPSSVALYLFYIIELTFQIIPDVKCVFILYAYSQSRFHGHLVYIKMEDTEPSKLFTYDSGYRYCWKPYHERSSFIKG